MGHLLGETTGVLAPRALHAAPRVPCGALWAPSTVLPEGTQELQSVDPTKDAAAACTHHHPQPASPWRASIQPHPSRNRPPAKQMLGDHLCGSYGTPEVMYPFFLVLNYCCNVFLIFSGRVVEKGHMIFIDDMDMFFRNPNEAHKPLRASSRNSNKSQRMAHGA